MTTKEKPIETIKELIAYCFYTYDGKDDFAFNECWDVEEDKRISPKLLKKLRKMAGEL